MNLKDIRFANLAVDFDIDRVKNEVSQISTLYDFYASEYFLNDQWRIPIFSEEQIQNTSITSFAGENILKKYPGWKGCSLTYLDDIPTSVQGFNKIRRIHAGVSWEWREDIDIPYTKSIIEQFKFKSFHTVRLLIIPPTGMGLIHYDDPGSYYDNGGFSVTLNIASGGSPIVFLNDGKQYDVWPGKCHIFRDDCWHGIPQVTDYRIQIRVNGIPNEETISNLVVNDDSIVFANNTKVEQIQI